MANVESSTFGSILDETLSFKTKETHISEEKGNPNGEKSCKKPKRELLVIRETKRNNQKEDGKEMFLYY